MITRSNGEMSPPSNFSSISTPRTDKSMMIYLQEKWSASTCHGYPTNTHTKVLFKQVKSCRKFVEKGKYLISELSAKCTILVIIKTTELSKLVCKE